MKKEVKAETAYAHVREEGEEHFSKYTEGKTFKDFYFEGLKHGYVLGLIIMANSVRYEMGDAYNDLIDEIIKFHDTEEDIKS